MACVVTAATFSAASSYFVPQLLVGVPWRAQQTSAGDAQTP